MPMEPHPRGGPPQQFFKWTYGVCHFPVYLLVVFEASVKKMFRVGDSSFLLCLISDDRSFANTKTFAVTSGLCKFAVHNVMYYIILH